MKITAMEEYGLRCMLQLAMTASDRPMTVAEVADNEGMTPEYAGKVLNLLGQEGLVRSVRGRNGGFMLARSADEISLADIVHGLSTDLFDSEYCERHAGSGEVCVHQTSCVLRPVWATLSEMVAQTLQSISLLDLMQTESEMARRLQPRVGAIELISPATKTLNRVRLPESG